MRKIVTYKVCFIQIGGINTSLDADSTDQFWPSSHQKYKHLTDNGGRRTSTVKG